MSGINLQSELLSKEYEGEAKRGKGEKVAKGRLYGAFEPDCPLSIPLSFRNES